LKNVPIVIGSNSTSTTQLPMYVAIAKGFFAKAGVNVDSELFSGGDPATMAAFTNNDINVIAGGSADDVEYLDNGVIPAKGGKFFAELAGDNYDIVTNKSITSFSQLEGKTVGISAPNGGDELYFEAVLKYEHIPVTSVTFVTAGATAARLSALTAGTVSAIAEVDNDRLTSEQIGNVLLQANKSPVGFPGYMYFGNASVLKHVAELQKFVGALTKATAWIRTNQIAATTICETATGATASTCQSGITDGLNRSYGGPWAWSSTAAVQVTGIASTIKVVASVEPVHIKLTASNLVDTAIAGTKP
jgi:NitT/TauT family transport system substrate-binding protein